MKRASSTYLPQSDLLDIDGEKSSHQQSCPHCSHTHISCDFLKPYKYMSSLSLTISISRLDYCHGNKWKEMHDSINVKKIHYVLSMIYEFNLKIFENLKTVLGHIDIELCSETSVILSVRQLIVGCQKYH